MMYLNLLIRVYENLYLRPHWLFSKKNIENIQKIKVHDIMSTLGFRNFKSIISNTLFI